MAYVHQQKKTHMRDHPRPSSELQTMCRTSEMSQDHGKNRKIRCFSFLTKERPCRDFNSTAHAAWIKLGVSSLTFLREDAQFRVIVRSLKSFTISRWAHFASMFGGRDAVPENARGTVGGFERYRINEENARQIDGNTFNIERYAGLKGLERCPEEQLRRARIDTNGAHSPTRCIGAQRSPGPSPSKRRKMTPRVNPDPCNPVRDVLSGSDVDALARVASSLLGDGCGAFADLQSFSLLECYRRVVTLEGATPPAVLASLQTHRREALGVNVYIVVDPLTLLVPFLLASVNGVDLQELAMARRSAASLAIHAMLGYARAIAGAIGLGEEFMGGDWLPETMKCTGGSMDSVARRVHKEKMSNMVGARQLKLKPDAPMLCMRQGVEDGMRVLMTQPGATLSMTEHLPPTATLPDCVCNVAKFIEMF